MTLVTLYQAEWCPFSSAVREVLTELGIDAVIRQVEPWPEQRNELRQLAGTDQIPVLQAEDGQLYRGIHEIFAHLRERQAWEHAADHRRRFRDHQAARESDATGRLLKQFSASDLDPGEPQSTPDQATIVDVPEEHRYELLLDGRRIGLLAYHRRGDRIAFTHTEVTPACEGRGHRPLWGQDRSRHWSRPANGPACQGTLDHLRRAQKCSHFWPPVFTFPMNRPPARCPSGACRAG